MRATAMLSLLAIGTSALAQTSGGDAGTTTQSLPLEVHVYNLSGASRRTLDQAMKEVARIFAITGVEVLWQEGRADALEANISDQRGAGSQNHEPDLRKYLVVRISPGLPEASLPDEMGYSLPDARFGPHAEIFYNRIERVGASGEIDLATLLGYAIAHEIGHVLLSPMEHSPVGIMKARWGKVDYEDAAHGHLRFTSEQCKLIHERVSIRLHAQINDARQKLVGLSSSRVLMAQGGNTLQQSPFLNPR